MTMMTDCTPHTALGRFKQSMLAEEQPVCDCEVYDSAIYSTAHASQGTLVASMLTVILLQGAIQ